MVQLRQQNGFTLIELVVVLVLLGILGATATVRFQDLSNEGRLVTQEAIAAEISGGSALNYAEGVLDATFTQDIDNVTNNCSTIAGNLLQTGSVPSGWTVNGTVTACGTRGDTTSDCTIVDNPVTLAAINIRLLCTG